MPTGIGSGIAGEVFTDEIGSGSRGGSTICPTRYSVEFNGSSQWGSEQDTKIDLGTDNFSFSFWFKTIGGGTKQGFHTTRLGSAANGLDIYLSAAGQLTADFDTISFVGSTVPSDNEWHHAVLSVDRLGDWKWYLDGVNINTVDHSAVTAPIENGGTSAWARTTNPPVDYFDGNLTELSIWGTALSSSEVLTIYNNMFGSQTCLTDLTFSSGNLIQNGSFNEIGPQLIDNPTFNAPTSPDLIVNGDFSAEGINLVDNPNFTDTGADVIYNGGFDTSIALGTTGSGWVNPDAAAAYNLGGCKITRGVSGFARLRGADILGNDDIISLSKSYKITYTVVENNGAASVIFMLAGTVSNDIPLSLTTHTVYVTSGTSASQRFQVYNQTASSNITLTDIVVKELGADWYEQDTGAMSIVAEGLKITTATAGSNRASQDDVTEDGKSYKVTVVVDSISTPTLNDKLFYYDGLDYINIPLTTPKSYTFYYTRVGTLDRWIFDLRNGATTSDNIVISSISVQELGEGWSVQDGWSIGEDKAICDGSTNNSIYQALSLPVGNLKVTFRVEDFTSGDLNLWLNLPAFTNPLLVDANGDYEVYVTTTSGANNIYFYSVAFIGSITNVTVQEVDWAFEGGWSLGSNKALATAAVGGDTLSQTGVFTLDKSYKTTFLSTMEVGDNCFAEFGSDGFIGQLPTGTASNLFYYQTNEVGDSARIAFEVQSIMTGSISNVLTYQMDPNGYWNIPTANSTQLVLNPTFTNTGPEEVTNGDFSDTTAGNIITNPNFTDTGIELMANYDFALGLTSWTNNGVTESGGVVTFNSASDYIFQNESFVLSSSYKAVIEGSGNVRYRTGYAGTDGTRVDITLPATVYFVATADSNRFQVYGSDPSSTATVSSVSVKELGADWTVVENGGGSVTFGDSFAEIIKTSATPTFIGQDYPVTLGASHKLTYTVTENTLPSTTDELALSSSSAYGYSPLDASASATPKTVYLTVTDVTPTAALRFFSRGASGSIKITDISVQELGEGWSVEMSDGSATTATKYVEFVETGARLVSDNTNSPYIALKQSTLSTGKLYKLICNVAYTDTGTIRANIGGYNSPSLVEGLNTIYTPSISGTNGLIFLRNDNNVDCIISNVSVEETGLDWISPDAGVVNTFSATGLTMTSVNGAGDNTIQQVGVTADDQAYKVEYTIVGSSLTAGNYLQFYNGATYVNMKTSVGTHILHFTRSGADDSVYLRLASNDSSTTDTVDIGSITIVEVQGWTLEDGKLVGDLPDLAKSATQDIGAIAGNSYKATMDVALAEEELITNGSFREVSTNLVVNGDFATGLITPWSATASGDGVVPVVEGSVGDYSVRIKNGATGGGSQIAQLSIFEAGKSYKVAYRILESNDTGGLILEGYQTLDTSVTASGVYHTIYVVGGSTQCNFKRNGSNIDIVIADISVQEVGQDWNLGGGWSIGEDKAINDGTGGLFRQFGAVPLNTKFKVVFTVADYVTGNIQIKFAPVAQTVVITGDGTYTVYTAGDNSYNGDFQVIGTASFQGSITNISVEEVGELKVDIGGAPVQSITTSGTHSLTFTAVDSDPFRIYGSTFTGSVTNIFVTQVAGDTLERWWRVNGNIATLTDPAPNVASNGILNDLNWNNNPPVEPDTP